MRHVLISRYLIVGKFFETGKAFLWLDRVGEGRRYVHRLAVRVNRTNVLIVVHTDPLRDARRRMLIEESEEPGTAPACRRTPPPKGRFEG